MSLQRSLIRAALLKQLEEGVLGIKKFSGNRFRPIWEESELPALSVYTISERAEEFDQAPRKYKKHLQVAVEIVVQTNDETGLDDIIDAFCGAVETAIYKDETLNGTCHDTLYQTTEIVEKPEGNSQTGSAIMVFETIYFEDAPATMEVKDFEGFNAKFLEPEGTEEMEAIIDVPVE